MIAIDVNDEQLKLATEMGAELAINPSTENPPSIVQEKARRPHEAAAEEVGYTTGMTGAEEWSTGGGGAGWGGVGGGGVGWGLLVTGFWRGVG
ncbi:alcohol dehydrogenase [Escherichia coli]|nr:alcohol dehydrogenase [Escherichia coli]